MEGNIIKESGELIEVEKKCLTNRSQTETKMELRKYLTPQEINLGINNTPPGVKRMLLTFLWLSGFRISEVVNIAREDIDFDNNFITLRWLKSRKYRNRVAPIHSRLAEILRYYVADMNMKQMVFPMTRQRAYQITKQQLNCNPHMLRHSFAVNWLRKGGDLVTLHKILGHAKIQTTMEYLKIVPMDQQKELEKITFD